MENWDGSLLDARGLDLQFHRTLWRASGNPYLERTLDGLVIPLFAHKTLEHVTHDVRRWRMSHHRTLLDAITGRSGDDLQAVLQTHLRMPIPSPSAIRPRSASRLKILQSRSCEIAAKPCRLAKNLAGS